MPRQEAKVDLRKGDPVGGGGEGGRENQSKIEVPDKTLAPGLRFHVPCTRLSYISLELATWHAHDPGKLDGRMTIIIIIIIIIITIIFIIIIIIVIIESLRAFRWPGLTN